MTPKQFHNIIALSRLAIPALAADKNVSEEQLAELMADLVACKKWAPDFEARWNADKASAQP